MLAKSDIQLNDVKNKVVSAVPLKWVLIGMGVLLVVIGWLVFMGQKNNDAWKEQHEDYQQHNEQMRTLLPVFDSLIAISNRKDSLLILSIKSKEATRTKYIKQYEALSYIDTASHNELRRIISSYQRIPIED